MFKNRSNMTSVCKETKANVKSDTVTMSRDELKEASRKSRGDCEVSQSTSHTKYFKRDIHDNNYNQITTDEFCGISESISGSSDTYHCFHKPKGKVYTEKGLLQRNLKKELDVVPRDNKWYRCKSIDRSIASKIAFLIQDPTVGQLKERLIIHLHDFMKLVNNGYHVEFLSDVCIIVEYLQENASKEPKLMEINLYLLKVMRHPIHLNAVRDVQQYSEIITSYFSFLGYLLMRLSEDNMFDLVSEALIWHISAPDSLRGGGTLPLRHSLTLATPAMLNIVVNMLAMSSSHRFETFLKIALLLACNSEDNCLAMMEMNIIENIFYRFNPYFPYRMLPIYDISPADPQDINVKLGDSSVHMSDTLSLLLVLLHTTREHIQKNPNYNLLLPCPDAYAQRCFIWAYRYECRARDHHHVRKTLTAISMSLIFCFGERLKSFSEILMADVLTLAVLTEIPLRNDWTKDVNFEITQKDVQFKKLLIHLSVQMVKVFRHNDFMLESRHWVVGLMYLLDPGLCHLRARWAPSLFAEIRLTALQALVTVIPLIPHRLVSEYGIIRRILWYIEWYSEKPFELSILYWCVRLLQVAVFQRNDPSRKTSIKDLFETHGIIILINLCYTLFEQKIPPIEKSQVIISLSLRILTSGVDRKGRIICNVYPALKWPSVINVFARKMLDIVLHSLEQNFIINDRWAISLLNFIWEAIIWTDKYREEFVSRDGIYKLLDLVAMTRPPVQCVALALICDVARAGLAVGQLVTWRAAYAANFAVPLTVKRGSTIATLLAAIFRDECRLLNVSLDENGVLQDMELPIMSYEMREEMLKPEFRDGANDHLDKCLAAADLAGSRMSKAFALLHLLSEDLSDKVSLADEAYKLYENIYIQPEDETVLVLCSHFLTLKLSEAWMEVKIQNPGCLDDDEDILEEFLHIGRGWTKEIKRQQNEVLEKKKQKDTEEECSLYDFLGRVRLNIALDALRKVRCVARSSDRTKITYSLINELVNAYHRRSIHAKNTRNPVIQTYRHSARLDDQNVTGQNLKVDSIIPKNKPKSVVERYRET